jgi:mannitol/fructose-specific phosphotransferase system IIA component (Ntr-type)
VVADFVGSKTLKISELISEDAILIDPILKNWENEIQLAGGLLEGKGFISHSYTERMVDLVKELGPYIVIMPNIAFSHARPENDVYQNSMSIIKTSRGISFGNKDNDPVHLLVAIAARTDEEHLQIFQLLAEIFGDPQNIKKIMKAESPEKILLVLEGEK